MSNFTKTTTALIAVLSIPIAAFAVPVQGRYVNAPNQCDDHLPLDLTHELGELPAFPIDEGIDVVSQPIPAYPIAACVADDPTPNDYIVRMINVSNIAYKDIFFVVDEAYSVGNFDGRVFDVAFPGATESFRIDGTVTPGSNRPLISESSTVDEIFEPGEEWTFYVLNFNAFDAAGNLLPPIFDSPGGFAASSASGPPSTASILANEVVPEPASFWLLLPIIAVAIFQRRTR